MENTQGPTSKIEEAEKAGAGVIRHDSNSGLAWKHARDLLASWPEFLQTIRALQPSDTFRVVMSQENAHLFQRGADGLFSPHLHDGKRIVENIKLARFPFDGVSAVANLAVMMKLAEISSRLQVVESGVRRIEDMLSASQHSVMAGAINRLAIARAWSNPDERRREIMSGAAAIAQAAPALVLLLNEHIKQMPEADTSFWAAFSRPSLEDITRAYSHVVADLQHLCKGLQELANGCLELGEPEGLRAAVSASISLLDNVALDDAIKNARLLPYADPRGAPEDHIRRFRDALAECRAEWAALDSSSPAVVQIEFTPEDFR